MKTLVMVIENVKVDINKVR